jgi:hypothetical protein
MDCSSPRNACAGLMLGFVMAITPLPADAQSAIDLEPFDSVRIGLPALTQAGVDLAIKQHRDLIDRGLKEVQEITSLDPSPREKEAIARFQETIASELQQIARLGGVAVENAVPTGLQIAANGQANDLPQLRAIMTTIFEVARVNQLMGDGSGSQQYQAAIQIWKTFMSAFQKKCYEQSFERDLVFGLERQNQMLGGGFDIMPCAYRLFTAKNTVSVPFEMTGRFTHCGLGIGEWKIATESAEFQGSGTGHVGQGGSGTWSLQVRWDDGSADGSSVTHRGELRLLVNTKTLPDGRTVETPEKLFIQFTESSGVSDNGSVFRASHAPSGVWTIVLPEGQVVQVPNPAEAKGELPLTMSDKPCRETDVI